MAISTKIIGITSESQQILDMYLENKKSVDTIMSALRKLVKETGKYDVTEINYNDYCTFVKPSTSAQASLQTTFIKFLIAYKWMQDSSGFEAEYWNPEDVIKDFEKDRTEKKVKEYKALLTFQQLEKILQFVESVSEVDYDNMKLALSFYLCFYTTIKSIDDILIANAFDYKDGTWTINGNGYDIPKRYEPVLIEMQRSKRSGLSILHKYVKQLGYQVGIQELFPSTIMKARDNMHLTCFQCGYDFFSFNDNWTSVNNVIMCNDCAKKILAESDVKKNYILNGINPFEVDILTEEEKENTEIATNSFDELRKKLPRQIDYRKLNDFLDYIGKLGEKFVLEHEKNALLNTEYYDRIDPTRALDQNNGFDILSFENNGTEVMIEVKTTTGNVTDAFIVTYREIEVCKQAAAQKKKYKIYRVGNILDSPTLQIIDDLSEDEFEITGVLYRMKLKSK